MAAIKFLCLFALIPLISCRQINFLPFEQVQAYLNDEHSSDYEVVSLVHTLHKRSLPSTLRIRAFQEDIELYLKPNENYLFGENTPVYLAYRGADGKNIFKPFSHDKLALYQDVKNRAALAVEEKGEKHLMYGIIGDYVIRPLTEKIKSSMRNRRSTDSKKILTARDNEIFADDHVLIKINQLKEDYIDEPETLNRIERSIWNPFSSVRKNSNNTKPQDRLYPEILVAADYNYFKKSGGDVKEFIKYQAVFWNGVDLLYRYFENPEIRLNIAGIVISQEPSADIYPKKYVQGNLLAVEEFLLAFKRTRTIRDDDFPKISYDIVIALTNYELVDDFSTVNTEDSGTTLGIAPMRGACSNRGSIAVIRDLLTFHGVPTAAHELGHLFGADHDFDPQCKADVPVPDYIMSYNSISKNQLRWSVCSLRDMAYFFKYRGNCLRNKPTAITSPYEKFLPGKIADVDAQCDTIFPGSKAAINTGESVCQHMLCDKTTETRNWWSFWKTEVHTESRGFNHGALDGSSCENGGICIQGECIQI